MNLIERLRDPDPKDQWCSEGGLFSEAAEEIERLTAECNEYLKTLKALDADKQERLEADKLVEAGILVKDETIKPGRAWKYYLPDYPDLIYGCVAAISDWRVAGKCLELMLDNAKDRKQAWRDLCPQGNWISLTKPISVPRAIVEAFCEARQ